MDEKLKKDIEAVVTKIFSEKEEADQKEATQNALNESAEAIDALTKSLEDKTTEMDTTVASLKDEITNKDSEITNLNSELEAAKKELEGAKTTLASTEETLENMKKDQIAEARMSELKDSKVVMVNISDQTAKVREMSDEEFAAYKDERIQLREAVMKELEEAKNKEAQTPEPEENADVNTENASVENIGTPPANVAPGQAIASAMNFETTPSDDMKSKYAKLGEAMAAGMKSDKSKQ